MSRLLYAICFFPVFVFSAWPSSQTESKQMLMNTITEITHNNAMGTKGIELTSAQPDVASPDRLKAELDVLFWHTQVDNTTYVYTNHKNYGIYPIQGDMKSVAFGLEPAFRLGLSYSTKRDDWQLSLLYTQLLFSEEAKKTAGINNQLTPLLGSILSGRGVKEAASSVATRVFALDFLIGRESFISPYVAINPFVGVKNTWFYLYQDTRYSGGSFLDVNSVFLDNDSKFWGVGPQAGASTEWFLGQGFSLEGSLSGAFQYGRYKLAYDELQSNAPNFRITLYDRMHRFSPMVDFGLGINYGSYFNQQENYGKLGVWYEGQYWFMQNQLLQLNNASSLRFESANSDISFHGLTIKAQLYF